MVQEMLKTDGDLLPQLMMRVRRDKTAAHLPRRHSNDERLHDNEPPSTTTTLDDMIDALDHDISNIAVSGGSSDDDSTDSPLSFEQLS